MDEAVEADGGTRANVPSEVVDRLRNGESVDVVVQLADGDADKSAVVALSLAEPQARYRAEVDAFLARNRGPELELLTRYRNFPMVTLRLHSVDALTTMAADARVEHVYADEAHETSLTQSLALIGQPAAAAAGYTGSGMTVAVFDTGLDYTLSDFGSCASPGAPGCKVAVAMDIAADDAALDTGSFHGTNVAGIVLGVAPGARVIALDVFRSDGMAYTSDLITGIDWVLTNRVTYNIAAMNFSLGGGSFTARCSSDALATPFLTARNAGVLSAASTGNNGTTNAIGSPACVPAAVAVGAVYDAAFGTIMTSFCTDASAADKVTCFSNSASFIDLLAPGSHITAGGRSMSGTSQAAPHVAGAIAVLRAAYPSDTSDQTLARLTSTGVSVTDTRNGVTTPRLNLAGAVGDCINSVTPTTTTASVLASTGSVTITAQAGCPWSSSSNASWITLTAPTSGTGSGTVGYNVAANTTASGRSGTLSVAGKTVTISQPASTPPTGGMVTIANGASIVGSTAVTLQLSANDADGLAMMCISNSTTCTAWIAYATSASWTLSAGSGTKTVRVWFQDGNGSRTTTAVSDTIVLDTTAPTTGTASSVGGSGQVALTWSGFSDAGSGIATYKVFMATGTTAPSSCKTGTPVYTGNDSGTTITSLTNGTTYAFRVCAIDNVGNASTGATTSAQVAGDATPPTGGSVVINGGDALTRLTAVTLTLSASDPSGVTSMCVSNATTCTAWIPYATTASWTLSAGTALKTVRVWFRDSFGNTTTSAVSDTIQLDTTLPLNGTGNAVPGNARVDLSWSGFTDATSGVASYKVVYRTTALANCSAGTVAYTGSDTLTSVSALTNGRTYYFRICATDGAGNISSGIGLSAVPTP